MQDIDEKIRNMHTGRLVDAESPAETESEA